MNDFDEVPALRAEIRRLNDELDRQRLDNGDLGERIGVMIQQKAELVKALESILNASLSKNNGAYMGEAVLCRYFEDMAKAVIAEAGEKP